MGKVKMIYIDPPYNTGHDFLYNDKFQSSKDKYVVDTGLIDENGMKQFTENNSSNPRFHSKWCSMMYPRLLLARNLLSDDGIIFIHIDENEITSLSMICKEIFSEQNELGTIIWNKGNPKFSNRVSYQHESILVFCKNFSIFSQTEFSQCKEHAEAMLKKVKSLLKKYGGVTNELRAEYKDYLLNNKKKFTGGELAYNQIDDNGDIFQSVSMAAPDKPETRSHKPLLHPLNHLPCPVPEKGWRYTNAALEALIKSGQIIFGEDETTQPRQKYLLKDNLNESVPSVWYYGGSDDALELPFDNPKPIYIAKRIISTRCKGSNDIILDFFSGSATTAQAVMELNAEDGGHRKFIMVQLPEACGEKSKAYKAGYKTICDIGEERIRRAGEKIRQEYPEAKVDTGFRVFRVDSTNMEDVYYRAGDYQQSMLDGLVSNIKPDRTGEDLLFGCLLNFTGITLDRPYAKETLDSYTVYDYDDGTVLACFDLDIPESLVETMARREPAYAIFQDSSFAGSAARINVTEIFKRFSPLTRVTVI